MGRRDRVSARAAKLKAKRLEEQLNCGRAAPDKRYILQEYVDRFIANHTKLSAGTRRLYRLTGRYLTGYFGADRRIDSITPAETSDWRGWLARGEYNGLNVQKKGTPSESTVCRCCKEAKAIFNRAVKEKVLSENPFEHLDSSAPTPDKKWAYVDLPTLQRLLDACPNQDWKNLLALCRFAGLRRGEAMRLRWSAVDMDRRRIAVNDDISHQDSKHRRRECPIVPELYDILFDAFMDGKGGELVVDAANIGGSFHRGFEVLAKRAKVATYARPFHTLRKNCETDWLSEYDVFTVCEWLGHGPAIAKRHYHRAKDETFEQAAGLNGNGDQCSQKRSQRERRSA